MRRQQPTTPVLHLLSGCIAVLVACFVMFAGTEKAQAAVISISGTVYTNTGTTTMGAGRFVSISQSGSAVTGTGTTTTASDGTYTLTGVNVPSGQVLTIYLDGNTEKGVTVTVTGTSDLTGIDIYQNYLVARCDNSCSLNGTNLHISDNNGDTDISALYTASSITSLVLTNGTGLFIPSGHTVAPGSSATVSVGGNLFNNGTLTMSAAMTLTGGGEYRFVPGSGTKTTIVLNAPGGTYVQGGNLTASSITFTAGTLQVLDNFSIILTGAAPWTSNAHGHLDAQNGTVLLTSTITIVSTSSGLTFYNLSRSGTSTFTWAFSGSWNMLVRNNFSISGGGGLTFSGSVPSFTVGGLATFSAGTINLGSSITKNFSGGLLISGANFSASIVNASNVTISSGTLTHSSGTFRVSGDWTKYSGATFTPGSNTVTLNGTNQTLSGSTTFYNLSKTVTSADTLTFRANDTMTVTNTLTLQGSPNRLLSLRSTVPGTQWNIDPQSTRTLSYIDVEDSNNVNATAITVAAFDSGNNTNWTFIPPVSVAGTVYSDDGVTTMASGRIVSVSVNGTATAGTGATAGDGTYSISNVFMNAGDVLTLYLDDNTEKGVTVTVADGSDMTGIDIYQDDLITRCDNSCALSNANLSTADANGDTDIDAIYRTPSSTTVVVAAGKNLYIPSGHTYAPGAGSTTVAVGGNVTNMGTYTNGGNNTLTLSGSSTQTLRSNGSVFGAITLNSNGGTYTLQDALTATGSMTFTKGTLDVSSGNYSLTVKGHWLVSNGRFNGRSGTVTFNAPSSQLLNGSGSSFYNILHNAAGTLNLNTRSLTGSNMFTNSAGTLSTNNLSASFGGLVTISGGTYTASSALQTFNDGLLINGGTFTGSTGDMTASGVTLTSGTFTAPSGTFNVSGNWVQKSGFTFTPGTNTVTLTGTNQTLSGSTTFYNLTKSVTAADTLTFEHGSTQTITNTLTLNGTDGNLLSLRSSQDGTEWDIDPQTTRTISYVDVKDSNNINATEIDCTSSNCTDSGNNTNWSFGSGAGGGGSSSSSSSSSSTPSDDVGGGGGGGGSRGGGDSSGMTAKISTARALLLTRYRDALAAQLADQKKEEKPTNPIPVRRPYVQTPKPPAAPQHAAAPEDRRSDLPAIANRRGLLLVIVKDEPVLYKDVETAAWYAPYVTTLISDGVAEGYKDDEGNLKGEFGVENAVTRAELLKMALEAAGKKGEGGVPRNTSAQGDWSAPYVKQAEDLQLKVFAPTVDVKTAATRAEVIQTVLEVMKIPTAAKTLSSFSDVPKDHPYAPAIAVAAFYGLISGDTDAEGKALNRFRPDEPINRAEVAKIIALVKEVME